MTLSVDENVPGLRGFGRGAKHPLCGYNVIAAEFTRAKLISYAQSCFKGGI